MNAKVHWIRHDGNQTQCLTFLDHHAVTVIEDMREYWPLNLRQIYYQLVAMEILENHLRSYKNLSTRLVKLREDGAVPWQSMDDMHRTSVDYTGFADISDFIYQELGDVFEGLRLDRLDGQSVRPEIWSEKDAISKILRPIAHAYGARLIVSKGFTSATFRHKFQKRVEYHKADGQRLYVIWPGDQDPSGRAMLPSLLSKAGLSNRYGKHVALTDKQVRKYKLPHSPFAGKAADPRYNGYVRQYGKMFVELDALATRDNIPTLQKLVRDAIESVLDMSAFRDREAEEQVEQAKLIDVKSDLVADINTRLGTHFSYEDGQLYDEGGE